MAGGLHLSFRARGRDVCACVESGKDEADRAESFGYAREAILINSYASERNTLIDQHLRVNGSILRDHRHRKRASTFGRGYPRCA